MLALPPVPVLVYTSWGGIALCTFGLIGIPNDLCFSPFQRIFNGSFLLVALCSLSAASHANAVLARHSLYQCLLLRESSQLIPEVNPGKMPLKKGVVDLYREEPKRAAELATIEVTTQIVGPVAAAVHPFEPDVGLEVEGDDPHGGDDSLQVDITRRALDEAVHGGRVVDVPCHRSPTKNVRPSRNSESKTSGRTLLVLALAHSVLATSCALKSCTFAAAA